LAEEPIQILALVTETVGWLTATVIDLLSEQAPLEPVTEYVLLVFTEMVGVVALPALALQVYELAPDAVSIELLPGQISADPLIETVTLGTTVIASV
jgi:hypothetical protein